jgi:uracil-DNA glycosylase
MVAAVRCAPPANKPTPGERDTCAPWLAEELRRIAPSVRVLICLGGFAWQALWPVLRATGFELPPRRPPFGHGAEAELAVPGGPPVLLLGCYHPSQQNTFTGRITPDMQDAIFRRAREFSGLGPPA